ncbi:hypothetical protein D3C76_1246440 [compost metagenome]
MGQRTNQHGTGIVVLKPARVGGEHAALLDRIAELEEAIVLDFQHADSAVLVMHLGQQPLYPFLCHAVSRQAPLYHAKNRHCPSMAPVQQGAPQLLTWQTALFRPDRARDEPPLES